jgi:hypothetical protein
MREYKEKEIKQIEEVENGIICDICKKKIKEEEDYKSRYRTKMSHFYEVTTHHNDWGNDSVDSYRDYDFCNEDCLFEFLKKYFDGKDGTLQCDIVEVKI